MPAWPRKKGRRGGFDVAACTPAIQASIKAQIGDVRFKALLKQSGRPEREKGQGRIRVSAKELRTVDGIVFDSKFEARVYTILRDTIGLTRFSLQPEFILQEPFTDAGGKLRRAIFYSADFLIDAPERKDWKDTLPPGAIVWDAKGMKTSEFKLKEKMFLSRYKVRLYLPRTEKEVYELLKTF